jgi:hypothetical protein
MKPWKRAVVFGSLGTGVALMLAGKRPAGVAVATVGLAILAGEYPEKFEQIREYAPDYISRGVKILQTLSQITERIAEEASRRGGRDGWGAVREQFGR